MTQPPAAGVFVLVLIVAVAVAGGSGPILVAGAGPGPGPGLGTGDAVADSTIDSQPAFGLPERDSPSSQTASSTVLSAPAGTSEPTQPTLDPHSDRTSTRHAPSGAMDDIESDDFDSKTFEITVHENGSATWTFRYELQLDSSDDDVVSQENFESFADEFESSETDLYETFSEMANRMIETGSETTDREMDATNFNRSAYVQGQINTLGVVEMSFTWHEFAVAEDDTVVTGDVFQSLYLTDDQSIVIKPGGGLIVDNTDPEGNYDGTSLENADSVYWSGETRFFAGHPRVVMTYPEDEPSEGFVSSMTDSDPLSWPVLTAGLVALLALGSGAAWYQYHRRGGAGHSDGPPGPGGHDDGATSAVADEGGANAGAVAGADDPNARTTQPADEHGRTGAAADRQPLSDEDLLTDEDRVVNLIKDNGGRMKQVKIVEETGWSKSKVSMLLSEMEDDGTISKLRVGRENIISLDGYEPEATKSPFDEQ